MDPDYDITTAELTDEELVTVLKNHGVRRRWLMKAFGAGIVASALGGSATAAPGGASIDPVYGQPYEANERVPGGVVDQEVQLHLHFTPAGPELYFDPVGVHLTTHEVINFVIHGGLHTVTAIHPKFSEPPIFSFPDRVPVDPGFTSPVMNTDDAWLYRFIEPGIYDIMCLPHYEFGMVCRVVVTEPNGDVPTDTYDDALLPPLVEAVFDDPAMTPANIVANGTVNWGDLSI